MTKSPHIWDFPRLRNKLRIAVFLILGVVATGFPDIATAVSLEEMMKATTNQFQNPSSAGNHSTSEKKVATTPPGVVPTTPSSSVTPPAVNIAPTSPTTTTATTSPSAALPTNVIFPAVTTDMSLESGNCGTFGVMMGGCPKQGVTPPQDMPQLKAFLALLPQLTQVSAASNDDRRELLRLARKLSRIDPQKLQKQAESLKTADLATRIGALGQLKLPDSADMFAPMQALAEDASGNGVKVESGMRQAAAMLRTMRDNTRDSLLAEALTPGIQNLETLSRSRIASATAKELIKPFFTSNQLPRNNALTRKPFTSQQIAQAMTLMVTEHEEASSENFVPAPAKTSRQQELSLENY